jgi:choline dehydrogenase-like flavoprotein
VRIVIVGGGAAGLLASPLLARAGHEIVVLEQDRLEPAADVEAAATSAFRPTAPQIVQPHIVMARSRELLMERLPDVYGGLLAVSGRPPHLTGVPLAADRRFRTLRDPEVFTALLRTIPATPPGSRFWTPSPESLRSARRACASRTCASDR